LYSHEAKESDYTLKRQLRSSSYKNMQIMKRINYYTTKLVIKTHIIATEIVRFQQFEISCRLLVFL